MSLRILLCRHTSKPKRQRIQWAIKLYDRLHDRVVRHATRRCRPLKQTRLKLSWCSDSLHRLLGGIGPIDSAHFIKRVHGPTFVANLHTCATSMTYSAWDNKQLLNKITAQNYGNFQLIKWNLDSLDWELEGYLDTIACIFLKRNG